MHVHQCPQCELVFVNEADVKDHLVNDHGADSELLEHRPRGWSRRERDERTSPDLVHPTRRGTDEQRAGRARPSHDSSTGGG